MVMVRRAAVLTAGLLLTNALSVSAQSTTVYHLHKEASLINSANKQLKATGPDATQTALQTANLKGSSGNFSSPIANFETQTGVPGLSGVIPANSTVTFALNMKVTSLPSSGSIYPYVVLTLNSASGQFLCGRGQQDGLTALTTTLSLQSFTCTTGASAISVATSDRFFLQVNVWIAGTVGNHNTNGELDIETGADSTVTVPNPVPSITSLSVTNGKVGDAVTITGTGFGTTGTVTFNGTTASTTSWNSSTIQTSVPAGVLPGAGPVVVTVSGKSSPGVTFTVVPHITSLTPSSDAIGQTVTIAGTSFGPSPGSVTFNNAAASTTSWSSTSITVPVPTGATTGSVIVASAGQASNGVTFTLITTGTVNGTITHATGGAALSGATVQAVLTGVVQGTATSAADGTYSIGTLGPGTYDVRVLASGYSSEVRGGTAISANVTTTVNVPMYQPGTIAGTVTQSDGVTPIVGAAVTVFSGPIQQGATNTNSSGGYSIASLHPGTFTVQAVNAGNHTKEQSAVVNENATTTANLSLDPEPTGAVLYSYDALGRLVQVTDPSGDAAIYSYDAVGNITSIARTGTSIVSVSGFTPTSGAVGSTVTIFGTGFSTTPNQNAVTFGCGVACTVPATVSSATATQLVAVVPSTAVSSVIAVAAQGQTANAPSSFAVTTAGGAPTISGFTPTLVVAGSALTVSGTNFDLTTTNDVATVNVASAQVSSSSATSLQATVPITTTGYVSVLTQYGTATSTNYLFVAPSPYTVANVDSTGSITLGTDTTIQVNTAGNIAMRGFDSTQGHRAAVSLTNGTFAGGGSMALYAPNATPTSTGFAATGFLAPVTLQATGTYTFILAPNSPYTGSATVHIYDVPPDQTGPIAYGGSVSVSLSVGQNARLSFAGAANDRVCAATTIPAPPNQPIASGTLSVLTPDGWPVASTGFNSAIPAFIDTTVLPSSGTYTAVVAPTTTSTGVTTVFLYSVPQDSSGPVTLNGSAVAVPLSPCQNGSLSFSGTPNQPETVHVTGNTFGIVTVSLFDGTTLISHATSSAAAFDLAPAAGSGDYTIKVDPSTTTSGTLNISVSGS
jgi:YD repeat-containing protein